MTNNDQVTKAVINALNQLKKSTEQAREKKQEKMFQKISFPLTLQKGLSRYTKNQLTKIRRFYDIRGVSNYKKGELQTLLEKKIPLYLESFLQTLDEERFGFLKKIVKNDGMVPCPQLEDHQLDYWLQTGLMFTGEYEGKRVLVIPNEILLRFSEFPESSHLLGIIKRNTEWIKLTQGLLYYYGTLTSSKLMDFLENTYLTDGFDHFKYFYIMEEAAYYYKNIKIKGNYWSNIRVYDPEIVLEEHKKREGLPYYPFSKEQLLQAGEVDYIERNKSYLDLVNFLTGHLDVDKKKADNLTEECVFATRSGGTPVNVLTFLQHHLVFPDEQTFKELAEKVIKLMNNTREWFLKGYTSEELQKMEEKSLRPLPQKKKKIGRNEKCPCGSNKKYKKCCGR